VKAVATIHAGACGQTTAVEATCEGADGSCLLHIQTDCPAFAKVAEKLEGVKVVPAEEFDWAKSRIHAAMRANCSHTACPVPSGIMKAVQVASGKKPPVDASISLNIG
jgi:hypothetical protein